MLKAKEGFQIKLTPELCKGCGICASFCPRGVLKMEKGLPRVVAPKKCTSCRLCFYRCPDFALEVDPF